MAAPVYRAGDLIKLASNEEAIVTHPGLETVRVLIITGFDAYRPRHVYPRNIRPADNWRDNLVRGQHVCFRANGKWYNCHVDVVSPDHLVLNPVYSHLKISLPRDTLRIMRAPRNTFPVWAVQLTPTYVVYQDVRYPCYHATEHHYCVDTRQGRAYFPRTQCTIAFHEHVGDPVSLGTFYTDPILPQCVLARLDPETIIETMMHCRMNPIDEALYVLYHETFQTHNYRPWSSHIVADQLDMAMQLNDVAHVQHLLDIAGNYTYANQSHRLGVSMRSRRLVNVNISFNADKIGFEIIWNRHMPRARTMQIARPVFRGLQDKSRPKVRTVDPYTMREDTHPFLYDYQLATFHNMYKLEERGITSHLFTYTVNGLPCNDYNGLSQPPIGHGGGCLAADVGLGKTVMMCALMLKRPMTTLIVVPMTLLSHWEDECNKRGLLTWVSHGKRNLPVPSLKQVKILASSLPKNKVCPQLIKKLTVLYALRPDTRGCLALRRIRHKYRKCHTRAMRACDKTCIITTPGMVRARYGTFDMCKRVVLDEAHTFKSANTITMKRIHDLVPYNIWCLTATPPKPLHLAKLLDVHPGNRIEELSQEDTDQMGRITLHLKRDLLELAGQLTPIEEMEHYAYCETPQMYKNCFVLFELEVLEQLGEGCLNKREVRQMVTDLERMCVHTDCVPLHRYGTKVDVDTASLDNIVTAFSFDDAARTRVEDTIANMDTCALCLESYERPTITKCGHVYCRDCVTALKKHTTKCPQCRSEIDTFLELDDNASHGNRVTHLGTVYTLPDNIVREEGGKVKHIERIIASGPTVVCSRHSRVIKYLGKRFDAAAITGKSNKCQRQAALARFEQTGVLFITERSAGVGLCLQKATNLVFVEPVWSAAVKKQVVGRIKRVGQTKQIHVWTLICENSIDVKSVWDQCSLSAAGARGDM